MAENFKVSVILTSYNHARYLREAIDSVLNQTYTDFELIIWDDASADDSWEIIQSYSDPRIRSFRNETRQGGGSIRKVISEIPTAEYIAIHHSDDVWESQKLEKQMAFLDKHPEIGAVFTNVLVMTENSEPIELDLFSQPNRSRFEWLHYFFHTGNSLCHPSILIRKACYENCGLYRYGFAQLADFDMWVRLCLKYDIHVLPEKLFRLRSHSNEMNASGNRPETRIRRQFEFLQILQNYRELVSAEELVKVFPGAEKYLHPRGFDPGFVLGMMAIEATTFNINITHLFALDLLFEALNDPERAKKVNELYGFTHKDLLALTASQDVFSVEHNAQLTAQVKELASLNAEKDRRIAVLSSLLGEIQNSRAWKMIAAYRGLRAKLFSR